MVDQVMDALLEDQVYLPPYVSAQLLFLLDAGQDEVEFDFGPSEHLAGELAHSLCEISDPVTLGIRCPDNVAHRVHKLTRNVGNLVERGTPVRLRRLPPKQFT